jgi:hypothetical protein
MEADLLPDLRAAFPDQEEFRFLNIALGAEDQYEMVMQLSTYIAAGEGDLFLFSQDRFRQYGLAEGGGLFLRLDDFVDSGALEIGETDTAAGRLSPPEGETGLYGVPAREQYGLLSYLVDGYSMVWAVPGYSGNAENAVKLISFLTERFTVEKPEGYDAYRQQSIQEEQRRLLTKP